MISLGFDRVIAGGTTKMLSSESHAGTQQDGGTSGSLAYVDRKVPLRVCNIELQLVNGYMSGGQ
jgi:hypothetical protein